MRVTRVAGRPNCRRLPGGMIVTLNTARLLQAMHSQSKRATDKRRS